MGLYKTEFLWKLLVFGGFSLSRVGFGILVFAVFILFSVCLGWFVGLPVLGFGLSGLWWFVSSRAGL